MSVDDFPVTSRHISTRPNHNTRASSQCCFKFFIACTVNYTLWAESGLRHRASLEVLLMEHKLRAQNTKLIQCQRVPVFWTRSVENFTSL